MKFTLEQWNMIQELVRNDLRWTNEAVMAMRKKATPEGKNCADEKILQNMPDYAPMKARVNILNDILTKLNNDEL